MRPCARDAAGRKMHPLCYAHFQTDVRYSVLVRSSSVRCAPHQVYPPSPVRIFLFSSNLVILAFETKTRRACHRSELWISRSGWQELSNEQISVRVIIIIIIRQMSLLAKVCHRCGGRSLHGMPMHGASPAGWDPF